MRAAVAGATGNVGTGMVSAPAADRNLTRGQPDRRPPKITWSAVDVAGDPAPHPEGAGTVVHPAWPFQPTRGRGRQPAAGRGRTPDVSGRA
ncbi:MULTISPECIES: hypothetical protein [unclassified Streptosporangium]|uniref:hypothetical protein n=1 Tax=unclassified Streptosporangium TaxID=2632669 RepID=UPI002E2DEAF4|nr:MULTISPECIES: hypothetical protein [unclassified Streptosporangium]